MRVKIAAVAILAAIGIGALVYSFGGLGATAVQDPTYLTAIATVGDVTSDVAATGTLTATSRTAVAFGINPWIVTSSASPPAGSVTFHVTEVTARVGATVKAGDTLAVAVSPDLQRQVDAAVRNLDSARIALDAATDQLADARDADSTAMIRTAKMTRWNAINEVADAEAKVADLEAQLAAATLIAPIDGVVTEVNVVAGFDAPAGAAIVVDAPGFQVTTDVVESDLASLEVGQAASVSIGAIGAEVAGMVSAISPVATTGGNVVSYPVTVMLEESPSDARSGMSADVTITMASALGVLTIPTAALQGQNGAYRVRTLGVDGQLTVTPVEVGLVTETTVEITSGLVAGATVVTGTASQLASGTTTTTGGFGGPGGLGGPGGFGGPAGNPGGGQGDAGRVQP